MEAAKAVGYTDPTFLMRVRREDEDFAEQWDLALEGAKAVLEAEATRRAVEGVLEPVFFKGTVVGYKTNYSDTLLLARLKRLDPGYRDNRSGSGDTNINFGVAILPMTAKNDDDWENRAIDMHSDQKVIELEAKPVENTLKKVTRGD